jgi:chromosome segregation protein
MFLASIELENFKSFSSKITIEFSKGFNLVQGPNGSGKSNLLDAISCAFAVEPKLLRVGSYGDLLNTQGMNVASLSRITLRLKCSQEERVIHVEITKNVCCICCANV